MADSLCGPSNALQNFQKHTSVDRTLQQDRLVARQSPSQGFRSLPGPNAGLLDPEFEAFQAGHLPLEAHQPPFQQFSHPPPHLQQSQPGPSAAWASDFQRLHVSSPPPQFQQQQFNPAQQSQGGWHQEFKQFHGEQRGTSQPQQGLDHQYQPTMMQPMMSGGIGMGVGMQNQFTGYEQAQQPHQPVESFDEEAFARAFEEAAQAEETYEEPISISEESRLAQAHEMSQEMNVFFESEEESRIELGQDIDLDQSSIPDQAKIGADLIHDPRDTSTPGHGDPDALARTAGHLLEGVKNNTSDKFANSEFLRLMRQLRDREVMVDGNELVARDGAMEDRTMESGEGITGGAGREDIQSQNATRRTRELILLTQTLNSLVSSLLSMTAHSPVIVRRMLNSLLRICDLTMGKSVLVLLSADEIRKSNLLESLKGVVVVTEERGLRMCEMLGRDLLIPSGNVVERGKSEFEHAEEEEMLGRMKESNIHITALPSLETLSVEGYTAQELMQRHAEQDDASYRYMKERLKGKSEELNEGKDVQDILQRVLGYEFHVVGEQWLDAVHVHRAEEILGKDTMDVNKEIEFLGTFRTDGKNVEISRSRWEAMLKVARDKGVKSPEFKSLVDGIVEVMGRFWEEEYERLRQRYVGVVRDDQQSMRERTQELFLEVWRAQEVGIRVDQECKRRGMEELVTFKDGPGVRFARSDWE